jgi:RND family efflux transporter MFP subunit
MTTPDLTQLKIDRLPPPVAPRRSKLRWIAAALFVGLIVAALLLRGGRDMEVETGTASAAYPYQNVAALNASGYVVAQRKAAVSTKATGRLEWLGVQEGSRVDTGQVLARLDDRDVRAAADQARANISVAEAAVGEAQAEFTDAQAALERSRELKQKTFISQAALDASLARFAKAQARLASSRAALTAARANARAADVAVEQTLIRAPFEGVVLTKNANVGDILTPFSSAAESKGAVVTLADMSTLEVEADVSESNLAQIKPGQPCEIALDALPNERFRGRVSRLVPTVDRSKATVLTKVSFLERDPRVLPEMAAKVVFLSREVSEAERKARVVVPPAAVVEREGKTVVFALSGTVVRQITLGAVEKIGDAVVADALKAGERVVLNPSPKLRDGSAVRTPRKAP